MFTGRQDIPSNSLLDLDSISNKLEKKPGFIHLSHVGFGPITDNFIKASHSDVQLRPALNALTNAGYMLYMSVDGENRFVHESRISELWLKLREGTILQSPEGIVYTLEMPVSNIVSRIVVLFVPMAADPFEKSLNRYFPPTYSSLIKFLPRDTAILKIGDIGGVKGAFYLDTTYFSENIQNVTNLIRRVIASHDVKFEDVVLYGASKGGTASLYYSITMGYSCISVDPILSDDYYESHHRDLHFTSGGIFSKTKQEIFSGLLSHHTRYSQRHIISSSGSPQFPIIKKYLSESSFPYTLHNSRNPEITSHPLVSRNTIWMHSTLINSVFLNLESRKGVFDVP